MNLPIKFPSDTEVILEEVARFRRLAGGSYPGHPGHSGRGAFLMSISPKAAWAKQYSEEQKLLERRNIRDFIARHAR